MHWDMKMKTNVPCFSLIIRFEPQGAVWVGCLGISSRSGLHDLRLSGYYASMLNEVLHLLMQAGACLRAESFSLLSCCQGSGTPQQHHGDRQPSTAGVYDRLGNVRHWDNFFLLEVLLQSYCEKCFRLGRLSLGFLAGVFNQSPLSCACESRHVSDISRVRTTRQKKKKKNTNEKE